MFDKKLLTATLAASLFAGINMAQADTEISANVALTSDYRFRGISQSNEDIALQGGFDLGWENGIYIGAWGSSVDFDSTDGFNGSLELDLYAGWAGQISDNVSVDVGYMYYGYPGDDSKQEGGANGKGDYQEVYLKVGLFDGTLGAAYSDDYYGETGSFYYLFADYSFALGENLSLDLHAGYNDIDENGGFFDTDTDSYVDYSVGLTASWLAVDWTLAYVGTDLDEDDVFGTDWSDDTVVFTISKSM
jgi:uncharacterized protein (TIGR02001 family)